MGSGSSVATTNARALCGIWQHASRFPSGMATTAFGSGRPRFLRMEEPPSRAKEVEGSGLEEFAKDFVLGEIGGGFGCCAGSSSVELFQALRVGFGRIGTELIGFDGGLRHGEGIRQPFDKRLGSVAGLSQDLIVFIADDQAVNHLYGLTADGPRVQTGPNS